MKATGRKPSMQRLGETNPAVLERYNELRKADLGGPGLDRATVEIVIAMQFALRAQEVPFKIHAMRALDQGVSCGTLRSLLAGRHEGNRHLPQCHDEDGLPVDVPRQLRLQPGRRTTLLRTTLRSVVAPPTSSLASRSSSPIAAWSRRTSRKAGVTCGVIWNMFKRLISDDETSQLFADTARRVYQLG